MEKGRLVYTKLYLFYPLECAFVLTSIYMSDLRVKAVTKMGVKYAMIAYAEPDNYKARTQLICPSCLRSRRTAGRLV